MDMICEVSKHPDGWTKASFKPGTTASKETTYQRGENTVHIVFMNDIKTEIAGDVDGTELRDHYVQVAKDAAEFVDDLRVQDNYD